MRGMVEARRAAVGKNRKRKAVPPTRVTLRKAASQAPVAPMWTPMAAARAAHRMRRQTVSGLHENPVWLAHQAANVDAAFNDWYRVMTAARQNHEEAMAYAGGYTVGSFGIAPTPYLGGKAWAEMFIAIDTSVLSRAEVMVMSPGLHWATAAAAGTLTAADTATFNRDDLPVPIGLLVLPEPLVIRNRGGSLSDLVAFTWHACDIYTGPEGPTTPGVRVTSYMALHGPVQSEDFDWLADQARLNGHPLPPLLPDGHLGMAGDQFLSQNQTTFEEINDQTALVSKVFGHLKTPAGETETDAEYAGGVVDDAGHDYVQRYLFAFWRLVAQNAAEQTPVNSRGATVVTSDGSRQAAPPDTRVLRLRASAARVGSGEQNAGPPREYKHRWPVRMHKVRQWYASEGVHKIIWRGPYVKGPDGAPFLVQDRAYLPE
jgi:hypothetical protein